MEPSAPPEAGSRTSFGEMTTCPLCGHENVASARFCNGCGIRLAAEQDQRRKPATLLFADVAGSTALAERIDAEAVRELMLDYFG